MIIAMPARMSGLSRRWPTRRAGPVTTTRCGSQRMIRAPIETSLSTKNIRLSNIFSKTSSIPAHWVAATMVVDGVYLVARLVPVFAMSVPGALHVVAYIGVISAMIAAVIAPKVTSGTELR